MNRRGSDDVRALVTPEGIVLNLQLAGSGQRLAA